MPSVDVHAGDFSTGQIPFKWGRFHLRWVRGGKFFGWSVRERIRATELASVEIASQEDVKRLWGTLGLGLAGGIAFGGLGMLAGALVGGRQKRVTFIGVFHDGRRILATTDQKTFIKIQSAAFNRGIKDSKMAPGASSRKQGMGCIAKLALTAFLVLSLLILAATLSSSR